MERCFLKDTCNGVDCDKPFCMKYFKLNKLYEMSLLTEQQRKHSSLYIDSDGTDEAAFKALKTIETNIETFVKEGNNLYIHSTICGNGKTSWAVRMLQSYLNKIWYKCDLEPKVMFINVPRFLLEIKDSIRQESEYISHIKEDAFKCDLLVWDEIGTKGLTQFEHENVLKYINMRLDSCKSNIYTSNLDSEELHQAIGDRLYSRIVNNSIDIQLYGSDKRTIKKEKVVL